MPATPADINYVKDKNDAVFFPVAHENGVIDDDGNTLATKLGNVELALDIIINGYTE